MWHKLPSWRKAAAEEGGPEKALQKEERGLYLQVSCERAQVGRDLRKPQLGAIHREHDAILLAVALGRARGRSALLRRHHLGAGRGGQQDAPEEELVHPRLGCGDEARCHRLAPPPGLGGMEGSDPAAWHAAGRVSPAGWSAVRMQPGKGRHC